MDERHVSNVTHASLTFLRNFHARGARLLGRRAVRRDTRLDSVRLRHRRRLSSSQGSQEASLAPRPTSRTPSRCPSDHRSVKATRVSTASRSFFGLRFFGCRCCGFFYCATVFILDHCCPVQIVCSGGISRGKRSREMSKQKFPSREHSWCLEHHIKKRKRITNIARDGEGVRGVPLSVALRRRRVKVGSSGDHLMPPSKPFSRHARRRSGVVFFPNDDEVL